MNPAELEHNTLIIGLGKTGLSVARYLATQNQDFSVLDTRASPPLLNQFHQEFPGKYFISAQLNHPLVQQSQRIILSPGISAWEPNIGAAKARGAQVINDITLFIDALNQCLPNQIYLPIVAITGSNGKTTLTHLITQMAQEQGLNSMMAGNSGLPVLQCLEQETKDLYVLELSSFQLELIDNLPIKLASVLNLGEDHLDRYASLEVYHQTKNKIYRQAEQIVLAKDYPQHYLDKLLPSLTEQQKIVRFSLAEPDTNTKVNTKANAKTSQPFGIKNHKNKAYIYCGKEPLIPLEELKLQTPHNHLNFLAALTIGHALGFNLQNMLNVIRAFEGLAYRCQKVAHINGVTYYNDSKATNMSALLAAAKSLMSQGRLWLLAGGQDKQTDFTPINTIMSNINQLLLFGQSANKIAAHIHQKTDKIHKFNKMRNALDHAQRHAEHGDIILLAPGCTSFDEFTDYQARGQAFNQQVYTYVD